MDECSPHITQGSSGESLPLPSLSGISYIRESDRYTTGRTWDNGYLEFYHRNFPEIQLFCNGMYVCASIASPSPERKDICFTAFEGKHCYLLLRIDKKSATLDNHINYFILQIIMLNPIQILPREEAHTQKE